VMKQKNKYKKRLNTLLASNALMLPISRWEYSSCRAI